LTRQTLAVTVQRGLDLVEREGKPAPQIERSGVADAEAQTDMARL
jgi:hypothetical protein